MVVGTLITDIRCVSAVLLCQQISLLSLIDNDGLEE